MINRMLFKLPWPFHEALYRLTGWVLVAWVEKAERRIVRRLEWQRGVPAWVTDPAGGDKAA